MKILMVCLGNICRSPLAEGILQKKAFEAGLRWSVESAGTISETGNSPHPLSQKVARLNGIEICEQRARRFVAQDFDMYDRIYALSADVLDHIRKIAGKKFDPDKAELLLNELHPGQDLDVTDPWYGPEAGYHEVFDTIHDACEAIIRKYAVYNPDSYRDQHAISNIQKDK